MLDLETLTSRIGALTPSIDSAPIVRLVQRLRDEGRETPDSVRLDVDEGVVGDRWSKGRHPARHSQVTLMRFDVANVMTEGAEVAILGDNVYASVDTSAANMPPGTLVRIGTALCRVTDKPHRGCVKFERRVGSDVWALTGADEHAARQLRGVHLEVLESGDARLGDSVVVVERPG